MLKTDAEVQDLSLRWQRSRISALKQWVSIDQDISDEIQLLKLIDVKQRDQALKSVFSNSRNLGLSFSRHFGIVLELTDLLTLFPKIGGPCLRGKWQKRTHSIVREKQGCLDGLRLGSFYCDYWREAIDGLTLGISEDVFFARHESCRHSDNKCLDVWFEDTKETEEVLAKGEIPDWASKNLDRVAKQFAEKGVRLIFEGVSEGTLFCQITLVRSPSCSDTVNWEEIVRREILQFWPGVTLKNTTPVAVYGEGF